MATLCLHHSCLGHHQDAYTRFILLPGLALGPDGAFLLTVDNLRTNVNANFAYQRMQFPQFGGNGRAQVTAVGGYSRLQIRVANDGVGRPMVGLTIQKMIIVNSFNWGGRVSGVEVQDPWYWVKGSFTIRSSTLALKVLHRGKGLYRAEAFDIILLPKSPLK